MEKKQKEAKVVHCKACGAEVNYKMKKCPNCGAKIKKPFYMKWWVWVIIIFIILTPFANPSKEETETPQIKKNKDVEVNVVDFTTMVKSEAVNWCDTNKVNCTYKEEYSDSIEKGQMISQSADADTMIYEGDKLTLVYSLGVEPTSEQKNALKKAESYSETMHMSKQGIYQQLTSEYGEQFEAEDAQYAVDNMETDWNANALAKAESYAETMNMSKQGVYDQLISEYGEKFTKEEAQYAIDNMEADWNANALAKAISYQKTMNMSKNAIYDQLISEYGEQFTKDEAQYAIDNLE